MRWPNTKAIAAGARKNGPARLLCRVFALTGFLGAFLPAFAQFSQQGPKLVGTGVAGAGAAQGQSVALSADGNTALVGGNFDNNAVGAAWVFVRNNGIWTQQGSKLLGSGALNSEAGTSVALSADGNTAIIGGPADNHYTGAVWVFVRSGGVWTQQGPKLFAFGVLGDAAGSSVALSADGNTAAVGAMGANRATGAVYILVRNGGVWTQQASLPGPPNAGVVSYFGQAVAISGDGNTLAAGAYWTNNLVGETMIFTRSGSSWTQQGPALIGSGAIGQAAQGICLSLSGDGNTLMTGGPFDNNYTGALWVFTRSARIWTQQVKLVPSGGPGGHFGSAVALSRDGFTAVVGSSQSGGGAGAIQVVQRTANGWREGVLVSGSDETWGSTFGGSVALSADGDTALAGGTNDNAPSVPTVNVFPQGAAWPFVRTSLNLVAPTAFAGVPFTFTVTAETPGHMVQSAYHGIVDFSTGDPLASLPLPDHLVNGSAIFTATLNTPGAQSITASDRVDPAVTITSLVSVQYANVQVAPVSLSLQYYLGTDPSTLTRSTLTVSSNASISYTTSASVAWLSVSGVGVAPNSISVTVNPIGMAAGTYNANVAVKLADHRSILVPVSLVIYPLPQLTWAPSVPSAVSFTSSSGSSVVQSLDINVLTTIRNVPVSAAASISSPVGGNWLSVSSAAASTPLTLHLLVNPIGLSPGTYSAAIMVTSSQASNSPLTLPVALSVSNAPSSISIFAFTNGASFAAGPAAPNTLVSVFGDFPGCTSAASVTLDSSPAVVFASASSQINFAVPSIIAGKSSTIVQIACSGLTSKPIALPLAAYSPGVFTFDQSGMGQAAVINQDLTVGTPSPAGTVVSLYGTGFGILDDPGPDGLRHVAGPVTASVGGIPATVLYAGEAPGYTSALQQFNLRIPTDVPRGTQASLLIRVGGATTQNGIFLTIPQ